MEASTPKSPLSWSESKTFPVRLHHSEGSSSRACRGAGVAGGLANHELGAAGEHPPGPVGEVAPETKWSSFSQVPRLEAAIEADPYDLSSWDARLRQAIQDRAAAPVFERALKQLPHAARIWAAYAEWCELQARPSQPSPTCHRYVQLPLRNVVVAVVLVGCMLAVSMLYISIICNM